MHVTANETIHGVEYLDQSLFEGGEPGNAPLFADFSSSIASAPLDVSKFGLVYAGAQKNLGPVGIGVLIVRRDLLERAGQPRATSSTTPRTRRAIPCSTRRRPGTGTCSASTCAGCWTKAAWPSSRAAARAVRRALYAAIDGSGGFYRNEVAPAARSRMNVPFFLPDAELDARFVAESRAAGDDRAKGPLRRSAASAPRSTTRCRWKRRMRWSDSCAISSAAMADARRTPRR